MSSIHNRETGQYPLSIGTSFAIESLMGIHPEIEVQEAPILQYNEVWINLRTLARNALNAVPTDQRASLSPQELSEALFNEMGFIANECRRYHQPRIVFYVSDMDLRTYSNAKMRKAKTQLQISSESLMVHAIGLVIRHFKEHPTDLYEVLHFRLKIKQDRKHAEAVILTHFPLDLVVEKDFKSLTLLESHTGALKRKELWYTKYYNGEELQRLPFTEKLLQIFGDKQTFSPLDKKWREDILEVAERLRWTPATSEDMINYGLSTLKNKYLLDYYRKL